MGFDVWEIKSTFVDESFRRGSFWFIPYIVAQINFNQDLNWFYEIDYHLNQKYPSTVKLKAKKAIWILRELDSKTQNKIWNSLQNTVIAILEPKIYIKKLGVELTPNADFKIQYEGRELLIDKEHEDYSFIDTILQKRLTRWILEDSPLLDINFSLNEIFLLSPKEDFFNIDNFLSLISKDDSRKEVVGNGGLDGDPFLFLYDIQDKMRNSAFYI